MVGIVGGLWGLFGTFYAFLFGMYSIKYIITIYSIILWLGIKTINPWGWFKDIALEFLKGQNNHFKIIYPWL